MALENELRCSGSWLFRWRSYAPLPVLALVAIELRNFEYFGGTHTLDRIWECVCVAVGGLGIAIRAHVVGHTPANTSGRNTERGQVAAELNTTGLYSLVRNPLYVGNALMWLGIALFLHDPLVALFTLALFVLIYERIVLCEEDFLVERFGDQFREWATHTPAFVPKLRGYVKPVLRFSLRNVLRREYAGAFGFVAILFAFEVLGDWQVEGRLVFDRVWVALIGVSALAYLTLRTLKKYTGLLDAPGR